MRRTSALGRSFASGAGAIIALVLAPGALWGDVTPPSISWEMPISLSRNDSARSLALSSDGVVVAVESETSASEKTTSIIAIDNSGELAWERVLGSNLHTPVLTEALSSTGDVDGYLVAARRYFPAEHGALIRVDVDGAPLWEKSFELREGWISAIASTKDGGALLFGTSDRAAFAMRFDADGEERFRFEHASGSFQVFLSGTEILGATGLVEGHVVVGPGPHAFGLSATGERRWMTRLGADLGAGSAYAAIARVDGSVRVAGTLDRGGGRGATTRDRLIAELDAGGGITAERFLPGDDHEHACGLIDRGDGRVVLFGSRRAVDAPLGDDRPHIEEIGPSGETVWSKIFDDVGAIVAGRVSHEGELYLLIDRPREGDVIVVKLGGDSNANETFRRGDVDSNGTLDLTDAVRVLEWLFLGGEPARCPDAADVNDEGTIDLTDAVFLLSHLFLGGDTPPPPGMESCGLDPTDDSLAECAAGC